MTIDESPGAFQPWGSGRNLGSPDWGRLPALPAGDGPVAAMLVSEGLCPWCGSDLEPQGVGDGPPLFGWCDFDDMGWSLTVGGTEPTAWFADEVEGLRSATQLTLTDALAP